MNLAPLNLHNLLDDVAYNHAVICTYTFEADFFEDYCLEKFNSLKNNANVTVIVDYGTYLQTLTGSTEYKPKQANIRYLLHPILLPGKFHAKLFLFTSKNKGRLIVGSANFTKPGITTNGEMINYFDFEVEKNETFKNIFQAAFSFLNKVNIQWPSNTLASNLRSMARDAAWLLSESSVAPNNEIVFLHNLDKSLWSQIISYTTPPVDTVYVLSRFFDQNPSLLDKIIKDLNPKKIKIFTQNGVTTLTTLWMQHPSYKTGDLQIYCCTYMDEGHIQNLHAKAIAIEKKSQYLLAFGSANFTSPALIRIAEEGNAELLLCLYNLSTKDLNPVQLFDPLKNAYRLKDDGTLRTAIRQSIDPTVNARKIILNYAELVGNSIQIRADIKAGVEYDTLTGKIQFRDGAYKRVLIHRDHDDEYYTEEVESIVGRLGEASSVMIIEASKNDEFVTESNPFLIINLLDIKSGQHVRRERYIREAQQGSIEFFNVLDSLIKEGNEEPLLNFFNYCDIPIMNVSRPIYARGMRSVWDGGKGMRNLGYNNLKIFNNLHEAAMGFYTRHFKKLQRHVKSGGINGIANYLHIYLAMGSILRSQVERLMQGFEACNNPISNTEWYGYREKIDIYFLKFKDLMLCLNEQYLPNLLKIYEPSLLRERFNPDIQPINDLCKDMLAFQARMEVLRRSSLKIKTPTGGILPPPFFNDNIFLKRNWEKYRSEQELKIKNVLWQLGNMSTK